LYIILVIIIISGYVPVNGRVEGHHVIYPGLKRVCKQMVQDYLRSGCKINAGEIHTLDIPDAVLTDIFHALNVIDRICDGCTGDHGLWAICGGLVSFLLGKTSCFTDIDIFVYCNLNLHDDESYAVHTIFNIDRPSIQIVRVNFNVSVDSPLHLDKTLWNLFASYVILNFDLPACMCALTFSGRGKFYVLDMSNFNYHGAPVLKVRKDKYIARLLPYIKSVPNLQQLVLFYFFCKY